MARKTRDPLIAAMIAKLPDGGEWPVDRQLAWLNLMAMAFGTVYGGDAAARLNSVTTSAYASISTSEQRKRLLEMEQAANERKPALPPFHITMSGIACNHLGKPILPSDVRGDLVDLRGQSGDMKTIQWADGSIGLGGADLTIVAA